MTGRLRKPGPWGNRDAEGHAEQLLASGVRGRVLGNPTDRVVSRAALPANLPELHEADRNNPYAVPQGPPVR